MKMQTCCVEKKNSPFLYESVVFVSDSDRWPWWWDVYCNHASMRFHLWQIAAIQVRFVYLFRPWLLPQSTRSAFVRSITLAGTRSFPCSRQAQPQEGLPFWRHAIDIFEGGNSARIILYIFYLQKAFGACAGFVGVRCFLMFHFFVYHRNSGRKWIGANCLKFERMVPNADRTNGPECRI